MAQLESVRLRYISVSQMHSVLRIIHVKLIGDLLMERDRDATNTAAVC